MLENIRNAITRLPMDRLGRKLGGHISSCPRHVRHDAVAMATTVAWQRPLPSNGSLNIQQIWAPVNRTREPILIKFGTQLQTTTSMIVT